ncbi:MAG: hypothetical protein ACT4P2_04485, partial [Pseudomonadota bacterium]
MRAGLGGMMARKSSSPGGGTDQRPVLDRGAPVRDVGELARRHTQAAIDALAAMLGSANDRVRVAAAD